MSKEFEEAVREYFESTYHVTMGGAEYAHEMGCTPEFPHPSSVKAAFEAGRALGRMEMKWEVKKIMHDADMACATYEDSWYRAKDFIEAIPEEVGE